MFRIFLLALLALLNSCSMTAAGKPMGELASEINATRVEGKLILAPGDVLSIRFPRSESWNQADLAIRADGTASFLALDAMHVAGLTVEMLDEKLTAAYSKVLAQPELTVQTTELAPRTIYLMGEVGLGGSFELPAGRLSLIEAFGLAQGFIRDTALLEHTMLVRWMPEDNKVRTWKIDASTEQWNAQEPIFLQAHDVIFVPAKPVVHVNDWVNRYLRLMIPIPFLTFAQ